VRVELGVASVLLCRTATGVSAFYNVCPHRGRALVDLRRGRGGTLRCPYHHFTFRPADGRCVAAPDAAQFEADPCEHLSLLPVRCEEFAGMLWVNLAPDAPPLREALGQAWDWLAPYQLESWGVTQHVGVQLAANWKASADVHSEAFHVHSLHSEVLPFVDDVGTRTLVSAPHVRLQVPSMTPSQRLGEAPLDPRLAAMLTGLGVDPAASPQERRQRMVSALRARDEGGVYAGLSDDQLVDNQLVYVFPSAHFNLHRDSALVFLHRPHSTDPARSVFEQISLTRGESGAGDLRFVQQTDAAIGDVTGADLVVAEALQRGYDSGAPGLTPTLHPHEACIAVMHQALSEALGEPG
jgi:phenylpropionate dioxygenase-like ring-hydroxylating dioxygenase large terminal subunit